MAVNGVRLNVADSKRIKRFLDKLNPRDRASVSADVLESIAYATVADAREKRIVRGRGLTSKPLAGKLTFRTGDLTRSLEVDSSRAPKVQTVGSRLNYAAVHEQGISPFPKRPYLEPASDFVIRTKAPDFFRIALVRATRSRV
jgi:hypothetical protein